MIAKGRNAYYYCLGRFSGRTDSKEPYIAQAHLEAIVERVYHGLVLAEDEEECLRVALEQELTNEVTFSPESVALARKRTPRLRLNSTRRSQPTCLAPWT